MKISNRRQKADDGRHNGIDGWLITAISVFLCLLYMGGTAAPTTRPAPAAMPAEFAPLLSRSIFVKGHAKQPSTPTTGPVTAGVETEAVLVLNGVTKTPDDVMAFVENRSTGKVTPLHVHDSIARGKVVGITLDALSYEADGRIIRVAIGDNLRGEAAAKPSSRPATGASDDTSAPSPQMQSILERMRLKRQQELRHK